MFGSLRNARLTLACAQSNGLCESGGSSREAAWQLETLVPKHKCWNRQVAGLAHGALGCSQQVRCKSQLLPMVNVLCLGIGHLALYVAAAAHH